MSPLLHPPASLHGFPAYTLQPTQILYRIHRSGREPWWFPNGGSLRFDLAAPAGTCYLAEADLGAFVEVFQDWQGAIIPEEEIAVRALSRLRVPRTMMLADCTASRALAHGVTAEIHASPDRGQTQAWAAAFEKAGFDGIRFFVRHDPAQQQFGIALFGQAGVAHWPVDATTAITTNLLQRAASTFGIRVLST